MVLPVLDEEAKKRGLAGLENAQAFPAIMGAAGDEGNVPQQQNNVPPVAPTQQMLGAAPVIKQEKEMRDAERDLQEAIEEDSNSGSEGYEKKEGGIFARMASWGSSVGDYLFGKSDPEEEARAAADKEKMGALGYYSKMANDTLETMARSPYAKFVDPTTVLGGQQTMVKNLDAYHSNRGIPGLRKELLEMDKARLGTTIGQAREYARVMNDPNVSEEQKAAINQYMQSRSRAGDGSLEYAKTRDQLAAREIQDRQSRGEDITPELVDSVYKKYQVGSHAQNAKEQGFPKTAKEAILRRADELVAQGMPREEAVQTAEREHGAKPGYLTSPSYYQPQSIQEAGDKASEEKLSEKYSERLLEDMKDAEQAVINIANGEEALRIVKENPDLTGAGALGETIRRVGMQLGMAKEEASILYVLAADIKGDQIARILNTQNVGHVSDSERMEFAKQAINLGDGPDAVKARLKLYILQNQLAYDSYQKSLQYMREGLRGTNLMLAMEDYKNRRFEDTKKRIQEITKAAGTVTAIDKKTGKERRLRRKQ